MWPSQLQPGLMNKKFYGLVGCILRSAVRAERAGCCVSIFVSGPYWADLFRLSLGFNSKLCTSHHKHSPGPIIGKMDGDPWWEWSCLKQSQMISTLSELTVSSDGETMESLISAETWLLVSIKTQTRDRDGTGTALVTSQLQTPTFYNTLSSVYLSGVIPAALATGVSSCN